MIPYTKSDHVTVNTPGADTMVVRFNGELRRFVQEAKAGDSGYIVQLKRDGDKLYVRDDAMGSVVTERLEGKVELFQLEDGEQSPISDESFFFKESIRVPADYEGGNALTSKV